MPNSHLAKGVRFTLRSFCFLLVLFSLFAAASLIAHAQQNDAERIRALQLYSDGKLDEALPLFEKLAKAYPNDPEVLEKWSDYAGPSRD